MIDINWITNKKIRYYKEQIAKYKKLMNSWNISKENQEWALEFWQKLLEKAEKEEYEKQVKNLFNLFRGKKSMYWQNEISGNMKQIVMKFFDNEFLTLNELKILKWYIIQWIDRTKLSVISQIEIVDKSLIDFVEKSCELSKRVISLTQNELYEFIPNDLLDFGIDPF